MGRKKDDEFWPILGGLFLARAFFPSLVTHGQLTITIATMLYIICFVGLIISPIIKKKWGLIFACFVLLLDIVGSITAAQWGFGEHYMPRNYKYDIVQIALFIMYGVSGGANGVWEASSYSSFLFPDVFSWIIGSVIGAVISDSVFLFLVVKRYRRISSVGT